MTAKHLIWSATRGAWVSAAELEPGEQLRGIGEGAGVVVELASLLHRGIEPVYNIEVDADHCYRVGEQALLVHNASAPCSEHMLAQGESKIIRQSTAEVRYGTKPTAKMPDPGHPGSRFNFTVVQEVVANLKYFGSSRSREPDPFMVNLIKYGLLTFPGTTLGLEPDDVGHIIGNQFGGYANKAKGIGNVFPQNFSVNRGRVSSFETNKLAVELQKPGVCEVCVRLTFYFDPASKTYLRPTRYRYDWWVDSVQQQGEDFDNPGYTS